MHARMEKMNRQKTKRLRSSTVEPVLDTLVNFLAMRKVNTRGIKQANKCIIMSAVAYNLKKLMKWEQRKINTAVVALKKQQTAFAFYFSLILSEKNNTISVRKIF